MNKIWITGSKGQLGQSLQKLASNYDKFRFHFTDIDECDITKEEEIKHILSNFQPDYIVNCSAYTNVDKAEEEKEKADLINARAVENLGLLAAKYNSRVLHISTDYVFSGENHKPYKENEQPSPVSAYGASKLLGEENLLLANEDATIIRTAWLYSEFGKNFAKTIIKLGKERELLKVVDDQIGSPTYATDLARAILQIIEAGIAGNYIPGIYHFTNEGVCSWYDFALAILQHINLQCRIIPIESKDFPTPAKRPFYSVLSKYKIKQNYTINIPHWHASLIDMLENKMLDEPL